MIRRILITSLTTLSLIACSEGHQASAPKPLTDNPTVQTTAQDISAAAASISLSDSLARQPEDVKARYGDRHPQETLEFFGLQPGMNVIEVLPGGGWYSQIISPYLGESGHLIGIDYDISMWSKFGSFATPTFIKARENWAEKWAEDMHAALPQNSSAISGYAFGNIPKALNGTADMALLIRASHNLARFNQDGQYFDRALSALYAALKPGGIVGIVQHEAPSENDDGWADGHNGYLKKSDVISAMETAGFEFVDASNINHNPRDIPANTDNVWRLPPTLGTSKNDEELRARMQAIGESSRMTLKFIKAK